MTVTIIIMQQHAFTKIYLTYWLMSVCKTRFKAPTIPAANKQKKHPAADRKSEVPKRMRELDALVSRLFSSENIFRAKAFPMAAKMGLIFVFIFISLRHQCQSTERKKNQRQLRIHKFIFSIFSFIFFCVGRACLSSTGLVGMSACMNATFFYILPTQRILPSPHHTVLFFNSWSVNFFFGYIHTLPMLHVIFHALFHIYPNIFLLSSCVCVFLVQFREKHSISNCNFSSFFFSSVIIDLYEKMPLSIHLMSCRNYTFNVHIKTQLNFCKSNRTNRIRILRMGQQQSSNEKRIPCTKPASTDHLGELS